ncbi:hypothetical protein MMC18_005893 [Xylographa bjoerkii]|nr:hypothetical protein [Xylographa bjoerkii]
MTFAYDLQSVAKALHEFYGSHIKDFAIIYLDNNGKFECELSRSLEHRSGDIFPREFCESFAEILEEEHESQYVGSSSANHQGSQRRVSAAKERRRHSDALTTQHGQVGRAGRRKRLSPNVDLSSIRRRVIVPRITPFNPSSSCTTSGDEDDEASETDAFEGAGFTMLEISISDEEALKKFYTTRFIQMQQIPCKVINKAWIKVVQPKKQARHPYNGGKKAAAAGDPGNGDLTKPDWWPREGCRHKEPDHIQKQGKLSQAGVAIDLDLFSLERLILLLHILRNLRDYKGGDGNSITVEQLEQSTKECFVNMPRFKKAGDYLNEVYRVRQQEERYIRGEIDETSSVAVTMPDKEPKEAARKSRIKAGSTVKIKRHRFAVHEPLIPIKRPLASQQSSPIALNSPVERPSAPQPKQEPLFNFNRLDLYADRAPAYTQNDSPNSSRPKCRSASDTAQTSFSSTEVECAPWRVFGTQGPLHSPYSTPFNHEGTQNMSYVPMSLPENTYAVSAPEGVKQFTHQHGTFNQTPMQDVSYTSPTFAQSVRDPTGWYSTPVAVAQQQSGTRASVLYTPSIRPNHHLDSSISNELAQSTTGMPYISESRYIPTQTQYNTYSSGTPSTTHHGLPGYDNMDLNTRTYY